MTDSQADRGKGTTKEEDRMAFHNLVCALNDLEVLSAINRLVDKPRQDQHKLQITQRYPPMAVEVMHILLCRILLTYTTSLPDLPWLSFWRVPPHDQSCQLSRVSHSGHIYRNTGTWGMIFTQPCPS